MWAPIYLRKVFVGGLDYSTTDDTLKNYFIKFGDVVDAVVMKDQSSSRSRGFGFITFQNPEHVDAVQRARPHKVDGRLVETKRAVPRADTFQPLGGQSHAFPTGGDTANTRLFIGGLPQDAKEADLERYFEQFGHISCVNIMYDKSSGRHRGFAFIDFNDYDPVDKVLLSRHHMIKGRPIDVKKAIGKGDINKIKGMMAAAAAVTSGPGGGGGGGGGSEVPLASAALHSFLHGGGGPSMQPHHAAAAAAAANNVAVAAALGAVGALSGMGTAGLQHLSAGHHPVGPHLSAASGSSTPVGGSGVPPHGGGLFHPRMPSGGVGPVPPGATSLKPGWQYTVSSNAEVLRCSPGNVGGQQQAEAVNGTHPTQPQTPSRQQGGGNLNDSIHHSDDDMDEMADLCNGDRGGSTRHSSRPPSPSEKDDSLDSCPPNAHLLFVEPFCGGSHRQLLKTILSDIGLISPEDAAVFTMPSKKWHWRARTSALTISQRIPSSHLFKVLFCSATLNLCELIGLRPDLARLHKVIYFHENQLVYPVRQSKERDFQYGYNQILSGLVADCVVFNSQYNLESFLREVPRHLNLQKDGRADTAAIAATIRSKSKVLYFPVNICHLIRPPKDALEPLHIIWPHRWEHDKDPESFFHVLFQLAEAGQNFRVSVLGENFSETPPIFAEARQRLHNFIVQWGYAQTKDKYWQVLHAGDVVVSTAHHEFFGVAMLEAVGAGCFPLCPNRLVYPEIYPQDCLYNTQQQLFKTLSNWCTRPQALRNKKVHLDLNTYSWNTLRQQYAEVLGIAE